MKKARKFCDISVGTIFESLLGVLYIKRSERVATNKITGSLLDFYPEEIVFTNE